MRLVNDLPPGQADHLITLSRQLRVPPPVLLKALP